jgi:hypothetical protein
VLSAAPGEVASCTFVELLVEKLPPAVLPPELAIPSPELLTPADWLMIAKVGSAETPWAMAVLEALPTALALPVRMDALPLLSFEAVPKFAATDGEPVAAEESAL